MLGDGHEGDQRIKRVLMNLLTAFAAVLTTILWVVVVSAVS